VRAIWAAVWLGIAAGGASAAGAAGPGGPGAAAWLDAGSLPFSPLVQTLVDSVRSDSLDARILQLTSFPTRDSTTPHGFAAADLIAAWFRVCGADSVYLDSWSAFYAPNVVAIHRGTERPDEIYVIGGHYDSTAYDGPSAPGADDNASGTGGVLESARVLCRQRFASTLVFVAFSGEERGLLGSNAYARRARTEGQNIVAMLNLDMIGYRAPRDRRDLDLIRIGDTDGLRDLTYEVGALYVPNLPIVDGRLPAGARSDHISFWTSGYPALFFFEDSENPSPWIHTASDGVLGSYNDPVLAQLFTKTAVALLATLAEPAPVAIEVADFAAWSAEGRVELGWRLSPAAQRDLNGVAVERAEAAAGPFEARTSPELVPEAAMRFVDLDVEAGRMYWYRLVLFTARGEAQPVGPLAVRVLEATGRTALVAAWEPDGGGPVQIRYALGRGGDAPRLDIFDVRGRRLRSLSTRAAAAGEYVHTWDRRDEAGERVRRGVYLVRLESAGTSAARKLVLAHD
jgi:hypothetical protein